MFSLERLRMRDCIPLLLSKIGSAIKFFEDGVCKGVVYFKEWPRIPLDKEQFSIEEYTSPGVMV